MAEIETSEESLDEKDERLGVQFDQSKRLVCVEYPGYIKNISKALETLGGEKTVNTTLKDPFRRVGVHFRPKDPYSKQVFGERFVATDVLMKVKRKKRKGKKEVDDEEEDVQYECELLGVIDTMVKFKCLADFQYLAPDVPDLLKEIHGTEILEIDTPLHLPPPVFARLDHPHTYHYQPEPKPISGDQEMHNDRRIGTITRKRRGTHTLSCNYDSLTVPQKANEDALKEIKRYNNDGLDIVQRLFNIRPIWSKKAVAYHLGRKASKIRLLLPCVGYYWLGGPWRTLWAKFGYDPRKNPAAKIYQKLDYRMRASKTLRGMKLPPPVRISDFSLHTGFQKTQPNTVVPMGIHSSYKDSAEANKTSSEEPGVLPANSNKANFEDPEVLPYVFHPDRLPPTRQVIYQLCDIHCAEVEKLISANDGKETECHICDGWLPPGTIEEIRKVLSNSLVSLFEKQKSAAHQETVGASTSLPTATGAAEQSVGIEEAEARFLDTLMDDDDVEAYDILDEDFDFEDDGRPILTQEIVTFGSFKP